MQDIEKPVLRDQLGNLGTAGQLSWPENKKSFKSQKATVPKSAVLVVDSAFVAARLEQEAFKRQPIESSDKRGDRGFPDQRKSL
jgi:hypothetical protein